MKPGAIQCRPGQPRRLTLQRLWKEQRQFFSNGSDSPYFFLFRGRYTQLEGGNADAGVPQPITSAMVTR